MKKFKLNNIYNTAIPITLYKKQSNGMKKSETKRFEPNVVYSVSNLSKTYMYVESTISNKVEQRRYTAAMEKALKDTKTPYEIIRCASCGGRIRKLKFNMFIETDGKVDE